MAVPENPKEGGGSRERLLLAAEEVFAQSGFAGARVEEIASRAGVNIRMLYHHFHSKEGLFLQVVESIHREIQARQDTLFERDASPEELLKGAMEDLFFFLKSRPTFVRILGWLTLFRGRSGPVPRIGRDYALQVMRPRLEELSRRGAWNPKVDPLFALMMFWSLGLFWFLNREEFLSIAGEEDPEEVDRVYLGQILALMEGGVLGKGTAAREGGKG